MSTATRTEQPNGRAAAADDDGYGPAHSEWMDMDWRQHMRWERVRGRWVNLVEIGQGPPLVFVHGHSGSWRNWLEQLPHFARTHRCIAPDLPGFGDSEMPDEKVSIEAYARFLDELLGKLDVESAPVVGNSMGGFVGAEMSLKHPERVERLVLVAAAGLSSKYLGLSKDLLQRQAVGAFARAINAYAAIPEARAETLVRRPRLRAAVIRMVAKHPDRLSPPMVREMIIGSGKPAAPDATDAIMTYDFRDRLDDVSCPTLIVWGEDDQVVPEGADDYERLIPGARKVVLPDTGHVPQIERPAAFNALLEDFLAE